MGPPASAFYSGALRVGSCTVDRPLHLGHMHGGTTPICRIELSCPLCPVPSALQGAGGMRYTYAPPTAG